MTRPTQSLVDCRNRWQPGYLPRQRARQSPGSLSEL